MLYTNSFVNQTALQVLVFLDIFLKYIYVQLLHLWHMKLIHGGFSLYKCLQIVPDNNVRFFIRCYFFEIVSNINKNSKN